MEHNVWGECLPKSEIEGFCIKETSQIGRKRPSEWQLIGWFQLSNKLLPLKVVAVISERIRVCSYHLRVGSVLARDGKGWTKRWGLMLNMQPLSLLKTRGKVTTLFYNRQGWYLKIQEKVHELVTVFCGTLNSLTCSCLYFIFLTTTG